MWHKSIFWRKPLALRAFWSNQHIGLRLQLCTTCMQGHCKICYAIRVFLLCRMQLYFCCLQVHREGMCKMTKNKRLIDMRQNAGDSTMVQHADFFLCKATLKKNIYDGIPCTFYLQIGCCCCFGLFSHCRTLLAAGYFAK